LANGPENALQPDGWPHAASHATTPLPEPLGIDFVGGRGALFWLSIKAGFWTILTLGFYRFWMKTRLRRYFWSAVRPGGHPMEYVGDPWEKLLGFFIAVVILTFYIGVVNLLLMFVSFSVFSESWVGYFLTYAGVVPIWFYASYRARRYVLGRTRWRSVRFGLERGAWGYAWRALVHWSITICTVGLLWPRMTFYLEKYRTDRTFFGSARLHQGGTWQSLYRAATPLFAMCGLWAIWAVWCFMLDPFHSMSDISAEDYGESFAMLLTGEDHAVTWHQPMRLWALPFLLFGLLYGVVAYVYGAKRIMANAKTADGIAFASELRPLRVSAIYLVGYFIAYIFLVIGFFILAVIVGSLTGFDTLQIMEQTPIGSLDSVDRWARIGTSVILYFFIFLMWSVLYNVFFTFPLMRHLAITTQLVDATGLAQISQRARDEFAEAEGFAEALDLGAAI
jgi:uncharacterized membrane protein YjgN (DUF898 family)